MDGVLGLEVGTGRGRDGARDMLFRYCCAEVRLQSCGFHLATTTWWPHCF
jgi:hypothetical protein